jgi:uncharacterized protein (DUF302 family)
MIEKEQNNSINNVFFENVSPFDFQTTVDKLSIEIEKKSWKISNIYDLQNTMEKHGKKVLPVKVFSLCHPNHSSRILERDSERIISSMMPCRVSVYEKAGGKTYISRMNSSIMAAGIGGVIEQVMTESANEVEDIIKNTLQVE